MTILQEAVPHLAKDSAVILVSTAAAYQYVPIIGMYGVSKTALLALTKVTGEVSFQFILLHQQKVFKKYPSFYHIQFILELENRSG